MSKAISVSTGPIFTIFSPNGRYLREFSRSGPDFLIPQVTLPWQPILCHKQNTNHVRFLQFLHHMKAFWVQMIDLEFFLISQGHCHDNQFCVVADLFARSQSISGSAGSIFTTFAILVGTELQMINPAFFIRYLKERCHGNQFCCKIVAKLPTTLALITLSFRHRMRYRLANMRIYSSTNGSTSCKNGENRFSSS